ncbi:HoxN/HupN/NixA family nickel/cobalt transporter [Tritonibacter horizontis]|uniref:Nickel/cobalt efflux system n=1 Tax=Tritonibacter horizontis TaxID=1768241 RepID=A0A132BRU0_9RHOB|nr:nickel/cobalt efflux protein RcnA [Tritonibacter horizontis]
MRRKPAATSQAQDEAHAADDAHDAGDGHAHHHHDHHHHHAPSQAATAGEAGLCDSCGHRHGPTLEDAAALRSWREALAIVLAIAARPCTGAVFLLLLTWRLDVLGAGVAGTFAMGLGTASVTLAVALIAAGVRGGLLARWFSTGGGQAAARIAALLEVTAGAVLAVLCLQLLLRAL